MMPCRMPGTGERRSLASIAPAQSPLLLEYQTFDGHTLNSVYMYKILLGVRG